MKALIIAAGYATRLRPLTDDRAKSLLPVGGRPMIDWIIDKVDEVDEVDEVHLVTNARFADAFSRWAPTRNVVVHDDGTTSNEDRLGAIGDIAFVVDRQGWDGEDLLVIAGDNLFDFSLADYVAFWRAQDGGRERDRVVRASAARAAQPVRDRRGRRRRPRQELRREAGEPPSNLVATATYIYDRAHVALLHAYLAEDNSRGRARQLHRVALQARAGLRLPLQRRLARHRRPLAAARGRQSAPARAGLPERSEYALEE